MVVSGQVFNNDMGAIPFANITVKETGASTSANADGEFSINVPGASSTLRFTHAGYDYDEISVATFLQQGGFIELWPTTLDGPTIDNNYKKPDNTMLYVALALVGGVVIAKMASGPKPRKVTV